MRTAIDLLIMHHENMRCLYPEDELMVLCECEGAVYDMRALALHALRSFDRVHDTGFFKHVVLDHLPLEMPDIDELLYQLTIPVGISLDIANWYSRHLWDVDGLWYAHRPLGNVMKVLRCLQAQSRTHVGLCAERSGRSDEEFLKAVNTLGRSARMAFGRETVFIDDAVPGEHASQRIIRACRHFQNSGFRLVAVIDNRVEAGLSHICSIDEAMEVLFLQARAVNEMKCLDLPLGTSGAPECRLLDLVGAAPFGDCMPAGMCAAPHDCRERHPDVAV